MFFTAYHFDGDPDTLVNGHQLTLDTYQPTTLDLHLVIRRPGGITVYDACPTREDARALNNSARFQAAIRDAGLPAPRVEDLGDVDSVVVGAGLQNVS